MKGPGPIIVKIVLKGGTEGEIFHPGTTKKTSDKATKIITTKVGTNQETDWMIDGKNSTAIREEVICATSDPITAPIVTRIGDVVNARTDQMMIEDVDPMIEEEAEETTTDEVETKGSEDIE